MNSSHAYLAAAFLLSTAALFQGCQILPEPQVDPTRHYAVSIPEAAESSLPATQPGSLRVALRPVELPSYLRKGVLVVREGVNELVYNDYARWAEPLEQGVARALQLNLAAEPRIANVSLTTQGYDDAADYLLTVKLRRAEGVRSTKSASSIHLVAVFEWSTPGPTPSVVAGKAFTASDLPWDGRDYAALAQGLSTQLQQLAHEAAALLPEKK
jgi:uncharacterized lipoprotein YmbA